ncbi:phosphotransferase [Kribbella albertanoniae]|uniref:Aminoglycoside phosphotransferase family protein n=1 Tax=Kribbella albertanoniae TaxID=1266829 RepID=A0A4R4PJA3_9ACTN|nr:phosphotransferase [Kribbella albertanoniae]TDC21979.1 aminoglycoside phosphotransferase family protein [Kribbella albertanoniae]
MDERLAGGFDGGASLVDGAVRRTAGSWTSSVHALLAHLEAAGFSAAPRALGVDADGREMVSFLPGQTVGNTRPWPSWTHSSSALTDVAQWLRRYHAAVADFVPPEDASWREGGTWQPGMIIAHNDAAPYNAVWNTEGLVGFVDWDMAGPVRPELDVAWVAFSWTPLHAPHVVAAEGFTDLDSRLPRLSHFLREYHWQGTTDDILNLVAERLTLQLTLMTQAATTDPTYQRMLTAGRDHDLTVALNQLATLRTS